MAISSLVFLAVVLGATGLFAYKASILFRLAKATKGPVWSGNRMDRLAERVETFFTNVLFQKAVLKKKKAGLMHVAIFWGFMIITIETMELFAYELFPGFSLSFIGESAYATLRLIQELFTLLVLSGVGYAFYRRLVLRPEGLGKSTDAIIILSLTSGLMLALLAMRSFHILAEPNDNNAVMFASMWISGIWQSLGVTPEVASTMAAGFRWFHHLLVLGFMVYIPSSKHLHVLTAAPNTFFRKLETPKGMRKVNLEAEDATSFGAGKISDLSWKDTLDLYACTECGRCQDACPAWNTQKPLSPKALVHDLKDSLYENKLALLSGKTDEVKPILGSKITDDVIWACTSCRACESACPVFIEQTDKIYEIRRNMVLMESRFPAELQTVFKNIENNFSPWAMSPDERDKWTEGLEVRTMAQIAASGEQVEYLFWVGCAGSFDDRSKKVSKALVSILKKSGIKFAILGKEEKCTGDPARRAGNEYLAQTLIQENVNVLNNYGVKKVVTACPHCFNALKNEWKDFGIELEVIHHTQLIAELIRSGKIKPTKAVDEKVTYHDSCYIGRWNNEYNAPRTILASVPQLKVNEIEQNKSNGMCCGAGGSRMWMEEHIGTRINVKRTEQLLEAKAGVVAANCPFCITMLTDGIKTKELTDKVRVMDVAEIVDQATV